MSEKSHSYRSTMEAPAPETVEELRAEIASLHTQMNAFRRHIIDTTRKEAAQHNWSEAEVTKTLISMGLLQQRDVAVKVMIPAQIFFHDLVYEDDALATAEGIQDLLSQVLFDNSLNYTYDQDHLQAKAVAVHLLLPQTGLPMDPMEEGAANYSLRADELQIEGVWLDGIRLGVAPVSVSPVPDEEPQPPREVITPSGVSRSGTLVEAPPEIPPGIDLSKYPPPTRVPIDWVQSGDYTFIKFGDAKSARGGDRIHVQARQQGGKTFARCGYATRDPQKLTPVGVGALTRYSPDLCGRCRNFTEYGTVSPPK